MCGIMGYVKTGRATVMTGPIVRRTFAGITSRGRDAAGYGVLSDQRTTVFKRAVTAEELAITKRFGKAMSVGKIVIGHSRAATNGTPKKNRNNHPFWTEDGRYVLIHNGIIRDNPEKLETRSQCDSEIALRMVEKHGISEAFERMSLWKNSDFAILVMDTRKGQVTLCRNSGRPASFVNSETLIGGYLIASTGQIIRDSLRMAGVMKHNEKIIETLPWSLYTFTPGVAEVDPVRLRCFEKNQAEEKARKERWNKYKPTYPYARGKYYGGWSPELAGEGWLL